MTNKQPNANQDSELLAKICEIFGVFPEELQHDLPGGIGTKKAEQLVSLIQTSVQEAEQKAINLKNKYEADIAHAIGYCQGLGYPDTYLQNRYRHLIELKDSSKKDGNNA